MLERLKNSPDYRRYIECKSANNAKNIEFMGVYDNDIIDACYGIINSGFLTEQSEIIYFLEECAVYGDVNTNMKTAQYIKDGVATLSDMLVVAAYTHIDQISEELKPYVRECFNKRLEEGSNDCLNYEIFKNKLKYDRQQRKLEDEKEYSDACRSMYHIKDIEDYGKVYAKNFSEVLDGYLQNTFWEYSDKKGKAVDIDVNYDTNRFEDCFSNFQKDATTFKYLYLNKGVEYYNNKEYKKALQAFIKDAYWGDADSMYYIGECYRHGYVVPEDKEKAINWYLRGAKLGDADCKARVSYMIINSEGNITPDYDLMLQFIKDSAYIGDAIALFNYGLLYEEGMGVKKSRVIATKYYSRDEVLEEYGKEIKKKYEHMYSDPKACAKGNSIRYRASISGDKASIDKAIDLKAVVLKEIEGREVKIPEVVEDNTTLVDAPIDDFNSTERTINNEKVSDELVADVKILAQPPQYVSISENKSILHIDYYDEVHVKETAKIIIKYTAINPYDGIDVVRKRKAFKLRNYDVENVKMFLEEIKGVLGTVKEKDMEVPAPNSLEEEHRNSKYYVFIDHISNYPHNFYSTVVSGNKLCNDMSWSEFNNKDLRKPFIGPISHEDAMEFANKCMLANGKVRIIKA